MVHMTVVKMLSFCEGRFKKHRGNVVLYAVLFCLLYCIWWKINSETPPPLSLGR